jgi:putative endonuclease
MGLESYELGREGEAAAETFLRQKGYNIIERNFRSHQGEVDIIARDGEFLVFVEVKSYSARSFGTPAGAIRKNKKQSIVHAAQFYLYRKKIKDTYCRFDVVTLYRRADGSQAIELYKDAFTVN